MITKIRELRDNSGCSLLQCKKALEYSHGDMNVAIAWLKAKNLAVATPHLSFDERVEMFVKRETIKG